LDFQILVQLAGQLAVMAVVVEAVTEIFKKCFPEGSLNESAKQALSIVVSIAVIMVSPVAFAANQIINTITRIIVAILISRGSNYVHDLAKTIRGAATSFEKTKE
jgi:undecaprenyl pyrophosphate phosphatase UppP